jgi:hypothetical protein
MSDRTDGLKQVMPGVPREWVERLVTSDDDTDSLTEGDGTISLTDGGVADVTLITARKSAPDSGGAATNAPVIEVIIENGDLGDPGIVIRNEDSTRLFHLRANAIAFVPKENAAAPSFYSMGVQTREATDTEDGGNFWISAGTAQNAASTGGNLVLFAGFGGVVNGKVQVGAFNSSVVEVGAATVPVDILGELTIGGIKFLVVTSTPNGSVTAPLGSVATNTTDGAFYSNTDGGTTWVAR